MPIPMRANGNILPATFVKFDTTPGQENKVIQAGVNDKPCGISQKGTDRAPYSTLDSPYAAVAGEDLLVYQLGEDCWLQVNAPVNTERRLKADPSGYGIPVTTDGDVYGALASQNADVAGRLIEVKVMLVEKGPN